MDKLTLPFTLNDVREQFSEDEINQTVRFSFQHLALAFPITRFVALRDLDHTTGDAVTWSREPAHGLKGDFGLMIVPSFSRMNGNFIQADDPHRAFFTLLRAVYGDDYNPDDSSMKFNGSQWVGRGTTFQGGEIIGHNTVTTNAEVGENVTIGHNTTIGGPGFGHVVEPDGSRWRIPHIGRVVIEDDVQIGSNTCIDRGCLGDTIIRKGARIDNLVHIAHNVEIGENAVVVAGAVICGSAKIGAGAWIAPNACVRNGVTVGAGAVVGLMANVVKDVPAGATVVGNPARAK